VDAPLLSQYGIQLGIHCPQFYELTVGSSLKSSQLTEKIVKLPSFQA
jgi:hypothetical protein